MADTLRLPSLDELTADGASILGNKAINLGLARQSGIAVPPGFVVPSAVSDAELGPLLSRSVPLIGAPPWVARSSAVGEDGSSRAFAGIFDTVLGIDRLSDLIQAITDVRASAGRDHVAAYMGVGMAPASVDMAVLVQPLIHALRAGVAFSRDPVDGRRIVTIEASFGLGKSVVEGSVVPDSFCVDLDGQIISSTLGSKRSRVDYRLGKLDQILLSTDEARQPSISNTEVLLIADLAMQSEDLFGVPIDIEWAFDQDQNLWLLQARPITTITAISHSVPQTKGLNG